MKAKRIDGYFRESYKPRQKWHKILIDPDDGDHYLCANHYVFLMPGWRNLVDFNRSPSPETVCKHCDKY